MAKKDIQAETRKAITKANKKFKGKFFPAQRGTGLIEFTFGGDALIQGCKKGADNIIKQARNANFITPDDASYYMQENTDARWEKIARNISNSAKRSGIIGGTSFTKVKPGMPLTGSPMFQMLFTDVKKARPKSWSILFLIPGPRKDAESTLKIMYDNLTEEMWNTWQNDVRSVFQQSIPGGTSLPSLGKLGRKQKVYSTFKRQVTKEHDVPSTTGLQAIESLKGSKLPFNAGIKFNEHDLYDQVVKALGVKLLQNKVKKRAGIYGVNNVISIFLGPNPNFGNTDVANVKKEYIKQINKVIAADAKLANPKASMSVPVADQAADDVIKEVIDNLVKKPKRRKNLKRKTKSKAKTFKNGKRTIELIKPKKIQKTPLSTFNIDIAGVLPERRNRQTGKKEKSLSNAALKGKINRSLAAEVRRNMGRPALESRTGTFANSVILNSLRDGPKSKIGEYSYQLDPYQTFENTGEKRWPQGYNPKPLIARSIREIAKRHVDDTFVLRRV